MKLPLTALLCAILPAALTPGACGGTTEMAQDTTLRASGLHLTDNPLNAPPGSMRVANNTVLRRPGIAEPRRGMNPDVSTLTGKADAFATFGGTVVMHTSSNLLVYRQTASATVSRTGSTVTLTSTAHGLSPADTFALVDVANATAFPEGRKTVVTAPTANTLTYTEAGTASSSTGNLARTVAAAGTYTPPAGHPMRFMEAGGALYFTTSEGLYRWDSLESTPVLAGVSPGLEGKAEGIASDSGWLNYGETVGYRFVWGLRDGDGDLIIGAPSGRVLVSNAAVAISDMDRVAGVVTATVAAGHGLSAADVIEILTSSNAGVIALGTKTLTATTATTLTWTETGGADGTNVTGTYAGIPIAVAITTPIPPDVRYGVHFLQAYRTVTVADTVADPLADPGEDMAVSLEYFPTSAEVTARTLTITDVSPFANGALGYFSPSAGNGGVLASKLQPPVITDVVPFKGRALCVVESFREQVELTLLATGSLDGMESGDGLRLFELDANETEDFVVNNSVAEGSGGGPGVWTFISYTSSTTLSAAQQLEETARSLARSINSRSVYFTATYASGPNDLPGKLVISRRALGLTAPIVDAINNGKAWAPALRMYFSGGVTRAANVVNVNTTGPHPSLLFTVGDAVVLYDSANVNFPDGTKTITAAAGANFQYAETGANVGAPVTLTFYTDQPRLQFIQEATTQSWAVCDLDEFDAWPPNTGQRNEIPGAQTVLYRILQQNDAAAFLTDNQFYRLTGNGPEDFSLQPIDSTARLAAPKTAITISQRVFVLTDEGVVLIDGVSVRNVSGQINEELKRYFAGTETMRAATFEHAFAFANEQEKEYWLGLPSEEEPDEVSQFYVLNLNTGGWTRVPLTARSAFTHPTEGRMYMQPEGSGVPAITRERRNRNATDYQDAPGVAIPFEVAYQVQTAKDPGAVKQWTDAVLSFEGPYPPSVDVSFATELDGYAAYVGETALQCGTNGLARTGVHRDASRSSTLVVRVQHEVAGEAAKILSLTVSSNRFGVKAGR